MGSGSFQLARVLGIRIGVNASWFLVLFLIIFLLSGSFRDELGGNATLAYVAAVAAAAGFFGSIVLHELGHAIAARRTGIGVTGIDLFFFGGLMKMSRDTDSPRAEFWVAVAGPLVTLGLVILGSLVGVALTGSLDAFTDDVLLRGAGATSLAELLVAFLVAMNIALLVFNLVPAFPLDGGRIARAAAWRITGDRIKATRFSAALGRGFALLLIAFGLYLAFSGAAFNGIWLAVLGWLLGQAARGAVMQTQFSERLRGVTVADIMDADPVVIPAGLRASQAWEEFFLRYQGWDWFAVVEADGRPAGIAYRAATEHVVRAEGGTMPMREVSGSADPEARVQAEDSLESLLGSEPLRRLGALLAVDAAGRLRGIVTSEQVARAIAAHAAPPATPRRVT
jgi:Zn-dependent protease